MLQRLRDGELASVVRGLQDERVELSLPKLELRTRFELSSELSPLGMPIAFENAADFSAITGRPGAIRISSVIHEAYIKVDETGTEAAAATAEGFATSAAPSTRLIRFDVDRPFVFLLRDTRTSAVLFAGTVAKP